MLVRGADLGLAFDGDGDRVIAVDQHGQTVDGDRMMALAALQLRDAEALADDTVVVTVMSNLGLRQAMAAAGIDLVETAVGDRSVLEALDAGGYSLGGEQSGHIDLPRPGDHRRRPARRAAAGPARRRVRAVARRAGRRGDDLVPPGAGQRARWPSATRDVADELAAEIAAAEAASTATVGCSCAPSGTEPLIRVMVEAPTTDQAAETAESLRPSPRSLRRRRLLRPAAPGLARRAAPRPWPGGDPRRPGVGWRR